MTGGSPVTCADNYAIIYSDNQHNYHRPALAALVSSLRLSCKTCCGAQRAQSYHGDLLYLALFTNLCSALLSPPLPLYIFISL